MNTGTNIKKRIGLLIVALGCSALLAWGMRHHFTTKRIIAKAAHITRAKLPQYDAVLFNQFSVALKSIVVDSVAKTFSGLLDITDGRDSLKDAHALPLLVTTAGHRRYFRIGSTETIIQDNLCIVIEHDQKRVIVSRQAKLQVSPLGNLQFLKDGLRREQFVMRTKEKNNEKVISFVNEHHITCKEFSVTFDTLSNKLTRLYVRMTDIEDPANDKKDRVMDIHIQRLINTADFDAYPRLHTIIKQEGENAVLTAKYEGYKLIIL